MAYVTTLISEAARGRAAHWVLKAPKGWICEVREPRRTLPQNDKMWSLLTDVAVSKPGGRVLKPGQWKALFMDALERETNNSAFGSRWEPSLDGHGVVNLGHKSSKLRKSEMSDLIAFIEAWGSENGVRWSNQEEAA
jgi:hypothetical protein